LFFLRGNTASNWLWIVDMNIESQMRAVAPKLGGEVTVGVREKKTRRGERGKERRGLFPASATLGFPFHVNRNGSSLSANTTFLNTT